ncbi:MAG TPA: TatD family hydrolase [Burkholderiaceae bacterium]|nr:TatD family hydrolase [Burkholderiaceae bacterium]
MWIDTHCHLDAEEFDADRDAVVGRARAAGVSMLVIPTGHVNDRAKASAIAARHGLAYALGLHPLWIDGVPEGDLERLRDAVREARSDSRFVAVGEIGIDCFEPGDVPRQEQFFREQLRIARDFDLPVIVHVRRSSDLLLKHLRRIDVPGGIVHAFNGSAQQADQFIARGFKLGFGGSLTYSGSERIRRHAAGLPEDSLVLETDAPYIAPEWRRTPQGVERTEPADLARIARQLAELRATDTATLARANRCNAVAALPRLAALLQDER